MSSLLTWMEAKMLGQMEDVKTVWMTALAIASSPYEAGRE